MLVTEEPRSRKRQKMLATRPPNQPWHVRHHLVSHVLVLKLCACVYLRITEDQSIPQGMHLLLAFGPPGQRS